MLPEFDQNGNLPPGVWLCTIEEVRKRFGRGSEERRMESAELSKLIRWAAKARIQRVLVGGSYVSFKQSPVDIDVVVLPGVGYPGRQPSHLEISRRLPLIHLQLARDETDWSRWAQVDFAIDRQGRPRGVVEIVL